MAENGFFEISSLTFFFGICSLMKAYAICCVYAQSHIWENFGSWVSANQIAGFVKSVTSPKQIDEIAEFFACCHKLMKTKMLIGKVLSGHGQK